MSYSPAWRKTIVAAVAVHAVGALGFGYVAENFQPAPKIQAVAEIDWVDVDLTDEVAIDDAEAIPSDAAEPSAFAAEDLRLPEANVPTFTPPTIERPKPQVKPIERPKPQPPAENPKPVDQPVDQPAAQIMSKPPVTVREVQPDIKNFRGFIAVAVRVGKDGKVKSTEILQSSADAAIDAKAVDAARQWTFRPALDQVGRPMDSDKIIVFDLRGNAS